METITRCAWAGSDLLYQAYHDVNGECRSTTTGRCLNF